MSLRVRCFAITAGHERERLWIRSVSISSLRVGIPRETKGRQPEVRPESQKFPFRRQLFSNAICPFTQSFFDNLMGNVFANVRRFCQSFI
jgi:hypothetical protein